MEGSDEGAIDWNALLGRSEEEEEEEEKQEVVVRVENEKGEALTDFDDAEDKKDKEASVDHIERRGATYEETRRLNISRNDARMRKIGIIPIGSTLSSGGYFQNEGDRSDRRKRARTTDDRSRTEKGHLEIAPGSDRGDVLFESVEEKSPSVDEEHVLKELKARWPGRGHEIDVLSDVIGAGNGGGFPALPSFLVQGTEANMPSNLILDLLSSFKLTHCIVDCSLISAVKQLHCSILGQLEAEIRSDHSKGSDTSATAAINSRAFIEAMRSLSKQHLDRGRSVYIVLNRANLLDNIDTSALVQHHQDEIFGTNVCVICVASVEFRHRMSEISTILRFDDLCENDAVAFLMRQRPDDFPENVYRVYLQQIYRTSIRACRDVREIGILATVMLPQLRKKCVAMSDPRRVATIVGPMLQSAEAFIFSHDFDVLAGRSVVEMRIAQTFPTRLRVLLVAAYLSSWNPVGTDAQFREEASSSKNRRKCRRRRSENVTWEKARIRGPQTFTFYRLWENYKAILRCSILFQSNSTATELSAAENVAQTSVQDFSLVNTLVEYRLVQRTASIMNPRYRCIAPKTLVTICGRSVGVPLQEYLVSS